MDIIVDAEELNLPLGDVPVERLYEVWGIQFFHIWNANVRCEHFGSVVCPDLLLNITNHLTNLEIVTINWIIFRGETLKSNREKMSYGFYCSFSRWYLLAVISCPVKHP